ncbi:metabolite traffic protein EboE [Streptomyces sp. NPDC047841]|uniref:metabolite traffic protein EboE n=1 Tax=Streptomyces sp. NPDC047841 TaxID=3154708 RepID=UPI003451A107
MRFRHRDGSLVHLAYCTNVHPAETLADIVAQFDRYAVPVRERLGVPVLGLGLWLARDAARELAARPERTAWLAAQLRRRGLEVVTLNAFPYAGFHQPRVKKAVYLPDWTDRRRLDYTLDCARVLAGLLPDDVAYGSVSTLPLGWRDPWTAGRQAAALALLDELAEGLAALHRELGRTVRVGLEPEPGCVVETTGQAALAWNGLDHRWLGVCLDTCHLAVQFEEPQAALGTLAGAGLPVVKAQLSRALRVDRPDLDTVREALGRYAEPRFLHQTRTRAPDGTVRGTDDLAGALDGALDREGPWRVHFHIPLHADPAPPLHATGPTLTGALDALVGGERARVRHLEVETYTWTVLPAGEQPAGPDGLAAGIAAELAWAADALVAAGLEDLNDRGPRGTRHHSGPTAARPQESRA